MASYGGIKIVTKNTPKFMVTTTFGRFLVTFFNFFEDKKISSQNKRDFRKTILKNGYYFDASSQVVTHFWAFFKSNGISSCFKES